MGEASTTGLDVAQLVFVILRCIEAPVMSVAMTAIKCMASLVEAKTAPRGARELRV